MRELSGVGVSTFIDVLASMKFPNVFNPYSDAWLDSDHEDAAEIRRENLRIVLTNAVESGVDSLWIARDLGYRGGRRTGLAMTDDLHLAAHGELFGVQGLRRPTKDSILAERTATVIWQMLGELGRPVFLWNVFPLHPHLPGDQLSNRQHSSAERDACAPFLLWLVENLKPTTLVAIGNDANRSLLALQLDTDILHVRHPSYGGQSEFVSSTRAHYGLHPQPSQLNFF